MQSLFEGSDETPGVAGIGLVPGVVGKFDDASVSVPHMGWNSLRILKVIPRSKPENVFGISSASGVARVMMSAVAESEGRQ